MAPRQRATACDDNYADGGELLLMYVVSPYTRVYISDTDGIIIVYLAERSSKTSAMVSLSLI